MMKILYLFLIGIFLSNCTKQETPEKQKFDYKKTSLNEKVKSEPLTSSIKEKSKPVIMKVKGSALEKKSKSYVTTDYDSRLLPHPDSNQLILKIPKNTKLEILESQKFQQGRMLNTWYKVSYKGKSGWTSSFNMKNPPQAVVTTVKDMVANYEKKLGKAPVNNSITGKIPEVVDWFKKNMDIKKIKFEQWYEPYPIDNQWNVRVDVRVDENLRIYNFRMKQGKVVSFKFSLK